MEEAKNSFTQVFNANSDGIFRYCFLRVGDREVAKDMTQSVFMKTWDHIIRSGDIQNIRAFIYKVARNAVIDHYRSRKNESLDYLRDEVGFDPEASEGRLEVENEADALSAMKVLGLLPKEHREIIILRYVEDLNFKEISEIIGESENAAAVRFHRAIKKARELFEPK